MRLFLLYTRNRKLFSSKQLLHLININNKNNLVLLNALKNSNLCDYSTAATLSLKNKTHYDDNELVLRQEEEDKTSTSYVQMGLSHFSVEKSKISPSNDSLTNINSSKTTPASNNNNANNNINNKNNKPTLEQLLNLKEVLTKFLPKFLTETHPYILYSPDVIFENYFNDPPKISIGLYQYALQLMVIRFKVNWKLTYAKVQILKITHDEQEGSIKIRWRINGVRAMRTFFQPWKIKVWKIKDTIKENDNQENWIDGFSILYVRGDGKICKHRLQRVIGQKEEEEVTVNKAKKILTNVTVTT